MIAELLQHMTPQEKEEVDQLLRSSQQPVDRTVFPFDDGRGRYWTSAEDCKASSHLFPSPIDDDGHEAHMAKFRVWADFVKAHSVADPDRPLIPEVLLPMLNYGKDENGDNQKPRYF